MRNDMIWCVEDDVSIRDIEVYTLEQTGFIAKGFGDGDSFWMELATTDELPELVILDIMLPDGDGISLCREIKAKYDIPILFLSALSENDDIITALRAGGDDYLPKPYDIQVLIARVEARLRSVRKDKRYISFGRLRLDTVSMAAYFADNDLLTTQKEFSILLMLARNIGSTVPKAELYENVWGLPYSDNANALFTAVSRLNKKLDDSKADVTITYERGKGYALESI